MAPRGAFSIHYIIVIITHSHPFFGEYNIMKPSSDNIVLSPDISTLFYIISTAIGSNFQLLNESSFKNPFPQNVILKNMILDPKKENLWIYFQVFNEYGQVAGEILIQQPMPIDEFIPHGRVYAENYFDENPVVTYDIIYNVVLEFSVAVAYLPEKAA